MIKLRTIHWPFWFIVVKEIGAKKEDQETAASNSTSSASKVSKKGRKKKIEEEEEEEVIEEKSLSEEDVDDLLMSSSDSESDSDDNDFDQASSQSNTDSEKASSSSSPAPGSKRKLSWFQKKKKGLASKTASSSLGRTLFKQYVDKDTQALIDNLCIIIKKVDGAKQAKKVRQEILRSAVKIVLLVHEKKVTEDSFQTLIFSFRRICSAIRNAYHAKTLDPATAQRINAVALVFYDHLEISLSGLLSQKSLAKIKNLINYVLSENILTNATKHEAEFQKIAYVLALYLQN